MQTAVATIGFVAPEGTGHWDSALHVGVLIATTPLMVVLKFSGGAVGFMDGMQAGWCWCNAVGLDQGRPASAYAPADFEGAVGQVLYGCDGCL